MFPSGLLWVPPGFADLFTASCLPSQQLMKAFAGLVKLLKQCTLLMSKGSLGSPAF